MSYFDLGRYGRPVTTTSSEAQTWFDRGLVWTYGFNHEEAVACFERAVAEDPDCAMAHWGIAYALGPNYNKPWEFFDAADLRTTVERTHDAIGRALNDGYAAAMSQVYQRFGDDADVATLYADALMQLTPWQLWDLRTGEPAPGSRAVDAAAVLDRALATDAGHEHPGLLHMYIHLWEMSTTPERALPVNATSLIASLEQLLGPTEYRIVGPEGEVVLEP